MKKVLLDFVEYAIAKKIQGGLTFSDLTSEAGSNISDLNGNVSTLQQTSEAITAPAIPTKPNAPATSLPI